MRDKKKKKSVIIKTIQKSTVNSLLPAINKENSFLRMNYDY